MTYEEMINLTNEELEEMAQRADEIFAIPDAGDQF